MGSARTTSDAELLASDVGSDFGEFYSRHVDGVAAYLGRRVRRGDLVLDLTAEAFARALERREQFDPARGPAIAWLLTIAHSLLVDTVRVRRVAADARRRLAMEPRFLDDEGIAAIERRTSGSLEQALELLPPEQRDAVRRRVLDEETYPEIASDIEVSEQVVRQRVSRGLSTLRRLAKESS